MIYKVYSVFDSKIEAYLQPFFMQAKGQAIRGFSDLVNDKNHVFGKHPEDYCLFELGSYDDSSAKFDLNKNPLSIGVGVEFLKT